MATNKQVKNLIGTPSLPVPIAAGANRVSGSFSLDTVKGLSVTLSVNFGATPDANAKLEFQTSLDGENWDTIEYAGFQIDYSASQTLQKSAPFNVDVSYGRIKVSNLDSADSISVWVSMTKTIDYNVDFNN